MEKIELSGVLLVVNEILDFLISINKRLTKLSDELAVEIFNQYYREQKQK